MTHSWRPAPGMSHSLRLVPAPAYCTGRSNVTSSPSTPPGPTRPFTSAEVIAFSCHPSTAWSLSSFSSFPRDILPPSSFSRTSTTLYVYRCMRPILLADHDPGRSSHRVDGLAFRLPAESGTLDPVLRLAGARLLDDR